MANLELSFIAIVIVIAVWVLFGVWWVWWRLPKWQVNRLALKIRDPKARADVEDNFRKTAGQLIGGAAVLIGAGFALFQFLIAHEQFLQQQQAARDLLISNQVSKGFEQLAGEKPAMRLGGIYALEGVMNDKTSPQYHQPVLEALCAFVRETSGGNTKKTTTDVQAALTVIGRRAAGLGEVDLGGVSIPGAILGGANLSKAVLNGANLSNAILDGTNLSNAALNGVNLSNAALNGANLSNAVLNGVNLSHAYLGDANLSNANLAYANLSGADLNGADLNGADLSNADLSGAYLKDANLSSAILFQTNLSGANLFQTNLSGANLGEAWNLTQAQLDRACGNADTKLPAGLTPDPADLTPDTATANQLLKPCR